MKETKTVQLWTERGEALRERMAADPAYRPWEVYPRPRLVRVQKASIDLVSFSELQNKLAEYNGDGRVSVLDTTAIQRMIASR